MSLLDTLKADQLTARRTHDRVATSLLTTLIGEASKISEEDFKKGQTDITDEKVIVTIKKFLKNAEESNRIMTAEFTRVMGHAPDDGKTRLLGEGQREFMDSIVPKMRDAEREISILNEYLPQQMTEAQLLVAISAFKEANPDANMGGIMAHLKTNYAGLYDGKLASQLAKG